LGGSIDEPRSPGGDSDLDDDDFFSNLEAELSQSLGDAFGSNQKKSASDDDDDDFFANLQNEMGRALEKSFDDKDEDEGDDFFSDLIDTIADEVEASSRQGDAPSKLTSSEQSDFAKLTVPELKDVLRSKGLKIGGSKRELIERLQNS